VKSSSPVLSTPASTESLPHARGDHGSCSCLSSCRGLPISSRASGFITSTAEWELLTPIPSGAACIHERSVVHDAGGLLPAASCPQLGAPVTVLGFCQDPCARSTQRPRLATARSPTTYAPRPSACLRSRNRQTLATAIARPSAQDREAAEHQQIGGQRLGHRGRARCRTSTLTDQASDGIGSRGLIPYSYRA